jgi:hypothetical protein
MYDPRIGRWTSQDPLAFGPGDPNLYRYARNDATNMTDPSGLVGIFFDGTLETGQIRTTIIRKLFGDYEDTKKRIFEFLELGGSPVGTPGAILEFGAYLNKPWTAQSAHYLLRRRLATAEFDRKVEEAYQFVLNNRGENGPVDIFGYSRGAIAAVYLAWKLKEKGIPVRYMGLIDPSTTYSGKDVPWIPSNVKKAYIFYADGGTVFTSDTREFASDNLIVSHDILNPEDPEATSMTVIHHPEVGHWGSGEDDFAGWWIYPDAINGLPLPDKNRFENHKPFPQRPPLPAGHYPVG